MIRILDILIAVVATVLFSPLMVVIALLVLFTDGWPVIYAQQRTGKDFRTFWMYKFRTMTPKSEDPLGLTQGSLDPRITKTGRVLRATKLDELPQLFNVLGGQMSMVGSRPQVPYYTDKFRDLYAQILQRKPGVFSPAATAYSHEDEILARANDPVAHYELELVPVKCQMDIDLVQGFGILKYLKVLLWSARAMLFVKKS